MIRKTLLASALIAGFGAGASAQELYVVQNGENFEVQYPIAHGNVVGGAMLRVVGQGGGYRTEMMGEPRTQAPADVVVIGNGENQVIERRVRG